MKILVTGAGGKTGRAVIDQLIRCGVDVVAFVRRKRPYLSPTVTQHVGDIQSAADLKKAIADANKVYHICPNMHPNEVEIGQKVIEAARETAVTHIVYHSVLHPQVRAMPHHWRKMQVESLLFESGIPFTILQPTAYMQNIPFAQVGETAVYTIPYPVTASISLVDLHDIAQIAAKVLMESSHAGATYELVGTKPLTQTAVAIQLSQAFGKTITAREMPIGEWEQTARQNGLNDQAIADLKAMFTYYASYGLAGNPTVLTALLGHTSSSLTHVVQRERREI